MTRTMLSQLLLQKGLKATPRRLKILSACVNESIPLDVNDVAKKVGSTVHLATVYRTLEKLVTVGILEQVDFQEGKLRYEYAHHHHHHAVCAKCGSVEDVKDAGIEVVETNLKKQTGFLVTKHTLELFGICLNCQKKGTYV
jgi:Fe2+ or Zn2+ uptake regulation protein